MVLIAKARALQLTGRSTRVLLSHTGPCYSNAFICTHAHHVVTVQPWCDHAAVHPPPTPMWAKIASTDVVTDVVTALDNYPTQKKSGNVEVVTHIKFPTFGNNDSRKHQKIIFQKSANTFATN